MIHQLVERRLLLVDDELELLKALVVVMEGQNIQVETATDGRLALELIKQKTFHAVLCDIKMPSMTGLECLAQANALGSVTPFVFLTGGGESDELPQAMRLGALDFIRKPFNVEEVTEVLYRALDIGMRRQRILQEVQKATKEAPELYERVTRDIKMISIMRAMNNSRRSG